MLKIFTWEYNIGSNKIEVGIEKSFIGLILYIYMIRLSMAEKGIFSYTRGGFYVHYYKVLFNYSKIMIEGSKVSRSCFILIF